MKRLHWSHALWLLLIVLGLVIASQFHLEQTREERGPKDLAAERMYYLAGRLAERLRHPLEYRRWLLSWPDPDAHDTLRLGALGDAQCNLQIPLQQWVAAGGHLILSAHQTDNNCQQQLLSNFDLQLKTVDYQTIAHYPLRIGTWQGHMTFSGQQLLRPASPPEWGVAHPKLGGYWLLSQRVGAGRVTVSVDSDWLRDSIADSGIRGDDHAAVWGELLAANGATSKLWFFEADYPADDRPSGATFWLMEHAPASLLFMLLAVVCWLWRAWPRFGPRSPDPEPIRRSLLEHLITSGYYLWRQRARNELMAGLRQAIDRRMARHEPRWGWKNPQERAGLLAERTGFNPQAIYDALLGRASQREELVRHVKLLQTILHTL